MKELTPDDIRRARTYVSAPFLCNKAGLIEWIEALCDDWIRMHERSESK